MIGRIEQSSHSNWLGADNLEKFVREFHEIFNWFKLPKRWLTSPSSWSINSGWVCIERSDIMPILINQSRRTGSSVSQSSNQLKLKLVPVKLRLYFAECFKQIHLLRIHLVHYEQQWGPRVFFPNEVYNKL